MQSSSVFHIQELFQAFYWKQHSTSRELKRTLNQSKKSAWEGPGSGLGSLRTNIWPKLLRHSRSSRGYFLSEHSSSAFDHSLLLNQGQEQREQYITMGLFSLAPNPSPPHGPVWWNQLCSGEGCTFPVSTAPVWLCAGAEAGVTPAQQGQQRGLRARWTLYLQHAECICRSNWFTGPHKEAAVLAYFGEQVFSSGASDVAVVPALIHLWSWRKPECQHRSCQSRLCVCV